MTTTAQITLTDREQIILTCIAAGMTYHQIAGYLGIREDTLRQGHICRMFRRLGARNGPHAVHIAHQHGLLGGCDD